MTEGPAIEDLTRHLAETPEVFMAEPLQKNGNGSIHVPAVVADLLRDMGCDELPQEELVKLTYSQQSRVNKERNRLRFILLACWLGSHQEIKSLAKWQDFLALLSSGFDALARLVAVEKFVSEGDRREEFARHLLAKLKLRPLGEKKAEAENRLDALSTVKRAAVVKKAKAAEQRARKLREKIAAEERAKRAASVYSHE